MSLVLGKYQIIRKLGSGGMAEVFLARASGHDGFEKHVVLKRIHQHLAANAEHAALFREEAKIAALIDHPGVVQTFDFGQDEQGSFIVMEYVDGCTLREMLRHAMVAQTPLTPRACAHFIAEACEGLAAVHALTDPRTGAPLRVVHRDVSLENILIARSGVVKVADFGVSRAANRSQLTQPGFVRGKYAYLAPEQATGEQFDHRADIWALGICLYELLAASRPFTAENEAAITHKIVAGTYTPIEEVRPDCPAELAEIVTIALSPRREGRFSDCHAFARKLNAFLSAHGGPLAALEVHALVEAVAGPPERRHSPPAQDSAAPAVAEPVVAAAAVAAGAFGSTSPFYEEEHGFTSNVALGPDGALHREPGAEEPPPRETALAFDPEPEAEPAPSPDGERMELTTNADIEIVPSDAPSYTPIASAIYEPPPPEETSRDVFFWLGILCMLAAVGVLAYSAIRPFDDDDINAQSFTTAREGATTQARAGAVHEETDAGTLIHIEDIKDSPLPALPNLPTMGGRIEPIYVESVPSGAEVFYNGELMGTTPYGADGPSNGVARITLKKKGYKNVDLFVEAGKELKKTVVLKRGKNK